MTSFCIFAFRNINIQWFDFDFEHYRNSYNHYTSVHIYVSSFKVRFECWLLTASADRTCHIWQRLHVLLPLSSKTVLCVYIKPEVQLRPISCSRGTRGWQLQSLAGFKNVPLDIFYCQQLPIFCHIFAILFSQRISLSHITTIMS